MADQTLNETGGPQSVPHTEGYPGYRTSLAAVAAGANGDPAGFSGGPQSMLAEVFGGGSLDDFLGPVRPNPSLLAAVQSAARGIGNSFVASKADAEPAISIAADAMAIPKAPADLTWVSELIALTARQAHSPTVTQEPTIMAGTVIDQRIRAEFARVDRSGQALSGDEMARDALVAVIAYETHRAAVAAREEAPDYLDSATKVLGTHRAPELVRAAIVNFGASPDLRREFASAEDYATYVAGVASGKIDASKTTPAGRPGQLSETLASIPGEEPWRAQWRNDPALRAEFRDDETVYLAVLRGDQAQSRERRARPGRGGVRK